MTQPLSQPPRPRCACPCSLGVTANTLLLVGFPELLQLREEGLGLAGDGRAVVQRPWSGQHTKELLCGQDSGDARHWHPRPPALTPPCLVQTWRGPSTHVTVGFVSCLSTLMHIQSSTQKIFIEPLLWARRCFTCWGKNSDLDKAPALVRLTF